MKLYKYVALALLLFFTDIRANAHYIHSYYKSTEWPVLNKNQSEQRMFLIAVIDSDDETIGERCKADLDAIMGAFNDYADEINATLESKVITGDGFSKEAVNDAIDSWLKNQQPSGNDIVIFYYSGHGFRFPSDASDYPRMWLKNSNDKNVETANLRIEEDVYDRIVKLGAGTNIVLSDCCNSTVAGDNTNFDNVTVPTRKRVRHQQEQENNNDNNEEDEEDDNADKLFTPGHPLSILVTAAGKGELAGGKAENGGFFTGYLIEALDNCIYENSIQPAWENIFKYADDNASYWARSAACPQAKHNEQGRCVQTAKIRIEDN